MGTEEWFPATVPGTAHTDLLKNRLIDDPFYGSNEKAVQWIDEVSWEYYTKFTCSEAVLKKQNVELNFEGLDTYAKVFLNDSLILIADNMFRTWKINCRKYLKEGSNDLKILFESAVKKGQEAASRLPYTLPGDEKVFTRKAQYQYGWDWGPRLVTSGIWRPVTLIAWDDLQINNVHIVQNHLTDSGVQLNFNVEVNCSTEDDYTFSIQHGNAEIKKSSHLAVGKQTVLLDSEIKNPKQWWPNGLGSANLYSFSCSVSNKSEVFDSRKATTGLRTIELIQQPDSIGKSFYFKVNSIPVFMKGANWIPSDNFLPRVTKEKYRTLLIKAKEANMNMLRVWGGGVYEDDYFYELCDSLGILVWQDFMFACAMYPGDSLFTQNVIEEAKDNIVRLRNHPCIAIWCGNNEIDEGWHNWGWQKQFKYSAKDSAAIWNDYKNLFHHILPTVVTENDSRSYISSSPRHGWGRKESLTEGDCHYWGVWWGMEPFSMYEKKVGRYMSEYGFQGMPALSTFKKFCGDDELSLTSNSVKHHQKHPTGYETIQAYMDRDYEKPKDFESYIYVSQLLQAAGMKTAIEAHRRAKPYCMGTLYWQLNDCWPVTSWSSIDYYGTEKALHYTVKKCFAPYSISSEKKGDSLYIVAVNDEMKTIKATYRLTLKDFNGTILWNTEGSTNLDNSKSVTVHTVSVAELLKNGLAENLFLKTELEADNKSIADNVYYFTEPKNLSLHKVPVTFAIDSIEAHRFALNVSAPSLAKNVFIDFGDANISLSDNYFDVLPGESKSIELTSTLSLSELKKLIKVKSLVDTY
jgi:beta-mannosidase